MSISHKVHKYYKTKFKGSGKIIFRCGEAGCGHYLVPELAEGRHSICWRCGDEFVLRKNMMGKGIKYPHCEACTNMKPGERKLKERKEAAVKEKVLASKGEVAMEFLDKVLGEKK